MKYAWKLSRLRHLIFDTDRPIVLGGRAMALDRRNRWYPGQGHLGLAQDCRPEDQPVYSTIADRLDAIAGCCGRHPEGTAISPSSRSQGTNRFGANPTNC
jgi:hypothetical protein